MKRRYRFKSIITVMTAMLFVLSGCQTNQSVSNELITIGATIPLTGSQSDTGVASYNGLSMAVKEINDNGGVLGKKIDLLVLDDKSDGNTSADNYRKLKDDGAVAVIGSLFSGVTMTLAEAANNDSVAVISPTSTNPDVTKGKPNIFRSCFIDDAQAEAMAGFALSVLNAKSAAVVYDSGDSYSTGLADIFKARFTSEGGIISQDMPYETGKLDVAGCIAKFTENKPDIIFFPNSATEASDTLEAMHKAGISDIVMLSTDTCDGISAYIVDPKAYENFYYPSTFSSDDTSPDVQSFIQKYHKFFYQLPIADNVLAYDTVYMVKQAIENANSTDPAKVLDAIKNINFKGIAGEIKYDDNNNPAKPVYILKFVDAKLRLVQKYS